MKRVLFFAVAMAAALSCSETELDNLVIETPATEVASQQVTFSVAMNDDDDATRVAVNDDWSVVWEDGDALLAYGMPATSGDYEPEQLKCEMSTFDESESEFTANLAWTHRYRLIYPYVANANISDEDYILSIDLTSQSEGATMNYMTTESTSIYTTFGDAYAPTMKHMARQSS
ncbi:MAG: hypothetical protein SNH63_05755 [Rikenellaceae bacterium]